MPKRWNPNGGPDGRGAWEETFNDGSLPGQSFGPPSVPIAPSATIGGDAWSDATSEVDTGAAKLDPLGNSYDVSGARLGKVRPFGYSGAWGGYSGTMIDDGRGGARYDPNLSGRGEAVGRARGLGEASANQQAYQLDYGRADELARMGQQGRAFQSDAMALARDTALGRGLQSQALGRQMLQQGIQAQQAGAASTRGGSLAQAAAMRQQAAGQGAFMQQGAAMLEAQRAADMAAAREQYMQQASGLRAADAAAQQLNQSQTMAHMGQELGQRGLSQQGQMGYESQGLAINKADADAALRARELKAGIDSAEALRARQGADRELRTGAAAATAGGSLLSSLGGLFKDDATKSGAANDDLDPYSQAVSNSDVRGKTKIVNLAGAALKRRGYQ